MFSLSPIEQNFLDSLGKSLFSEPLEMLERSGIKSITLNRDYAEKQKVLFLKFFLLPEFQVKSIGNGPHIYVTFANFEEQDQIVMLFCKPHLILGVCSIFCFI